MKLQDRFLDVEREMNMFYLERENEVRGLVIGLLTKQHVLLLGPPGTGKSALTNDLCKRIQGDYFQWLMSRFSPPEELFGPVSLKALENDQYTRVTAGKLPEADIAFLDEVFKANSAILNALLSILNERLFFNNGQPTQVPLQMVVGASNELPEDAEELGALWDRFLLRYMVQPIRDNKNLEALLLGSVQPVNNTSIDPDELAQAQAEVEQVDLTPVVPQIIALTKEVARLNIQVSTRRWMQCRRLVQANAWLAGRTQATDEDLEILTASLWDDPSQIPQVRQVIMALANPFDQEALEQMDIAQEVYQAAVTADEENQTSAGMEANHKLKSVIKRLGDLQKKTQDAGKSDARVASLLERAEAMNKEVLEVCLGL